MAALYRSLAPRHPHVPPPMGGGMIADPGLRRVSFVAYGEPVTQGSKDAWPIRAGAVCPGCHRRTVAGPVCAACHLPAHIPVSLAENAAGHAEWRRTLLICATRAHRPGGVAQPPLDGPLGAAMTFTLTRPASHPKTRRTDPGTGKDYDKLARAVGDACQEAGLITNDSRILGCTRLWKCYPLLPGMDVRPWLDEDALERPGCVVRLWQIAT
jgi:Holliday junction resolvase RusA-like endonuclease